MAGRESQTLPAKEAGLFRQVVKFYESKQYKKGIKAAEQILKKHPEHGETLAMKGLILNCLEKKTEAYELTRRGLKADLKSHVCWHVYGLLYRSDRNYDEAIKCYKNALRIDKENGQILRDLAQLQVQMRDISGFIETRNTLLAGKASQRNNWISFAIAHHLDRNYTLAAQVLTSYEGLQDEVPKGEEYEHSEMLLYKAMILEEGQQYEDALSHLESRREEIRDKLGLDESRARLLLKLHRNKDAEEVYRHLLQLNPDNQRYHEGLQTTLGLQPDAQGAWSEEQRGKLEKLCSDLAERFPKSNATRRIPLDFKEGKSFETALAAYVKRFLQRGIPSLFSDLKGLYSSAEKRDAIGRCFKQLLQALEADPEDYPTASDGNQDPEPAQEALLWTMFFMAAHYDKLGSTRAALEMVERCIQKDAGLTELYSLKSRILKHAGDLDGAAAAADKAQSLDLADRYLNSVAAKALFRAGRVEQAEKMAALFTKGSDQPNLLYEMQCMWYEIECGSAHLRRRDYGRALKNFLSVGKHFADFQEDQFDFHSYCVRKMTLRAYIRMLRMEDQILQNDFYAQAAYGAIEAYLALASAPAKQQQSLEAEEALMAGMSLDEKKKYKQKKRKEVQRKQKEEEARQREASAEAAAAVLREKEGAKAGNKKQSGDKNKEKDDDPDGAKLAAVEEPLNEATKLLRVLREHAGGKLRTHLLAFEVYLLRGRQLLALQAVKRAIQIAGASHPDVHRIIVRFCRDVQAAATSNGQAEWSAEVVQGVVRCQVKALLGEASLEAYAEAFLEAHGSSSLAHRAAAAEVLALLQPSNKQQAVALLLEGGGPLRCGFEADNLALAECVAVHKLLKDRLGAVEAASEWYQRCQQLYQQSTYFEGSQRTLPHSSTAPAANGVAKGKEIKK